jgi:hypothetical protein
LLGCQGVDTVWLPVQKGNVSGSSLRSDAPDTATCTSLQASNEHNARSHTAHDIGEN